MKGLIIRRPCDIVPGLTKYIGSKKTENFTIILLNSNNEVINYKTLFIGGIQSSIVDSRVVFNYALKHLAVAMIISHNHPGGNPEPSSMDKTTTDRLKQGCDILGITLLDHIIVTKKGGYFSFREHDLID